MSGFANHAPRVVLASRESSGIRVMLLWAAQTNTAAVIVRDDSMDDEFELVVEPHGSPLDVYDHPYAHAAWRGIDYRTGALRAA